MTNVFIVTKEGRAYTQEGLDKLTSILAETYKITDELSFKVGTMLNNPSDLLELFKAGTDNVIIVSTVGRIAVVLYGTPDFKNITAKLKSTKDKTSWEIMCEYLGIN